MSTSRITRDAMLMEIAHVVARRGTCSRLQVGAVFSRDGRIVSTGYNGAPAGMPHCTHEEYTWTDLNVGIPKWLSEAFRTFTDIPHNPRYGTRFLYDGKTVTVQYGGQESPGCDQAEHAERNAIAWAARLGLALEGTELHVTHAPCLACARSVVNAGITKVSYDIPYRLTDGVDLLRSAGIKVVSAPF